MLYPIHLCQSLQAFTVEFQLCVDSTAAWIYLLIHQAAAQVITSWLSLTACAYDIYPLGHQELW